MPALLLLSHVTNQFTSLTLHGKVKNVLQRSEKENLLTLLPGKYQLGVYFGLIPVKFSQEVGFAPLDI